MENLQRIGEELVNGCLKGFLDSVSLHKTLKVLVNSDEIRNKTFLCLAANVVMLLGSVFIFELGIRPAIENIGKSLLPDSETIVNLVYYYLSYFYHVVWILPIWIMCYFVSVRWCQDIANLSYEYTTRKRPKQSPMTEAAYGLIVWLFVFLEVQLLSNIIPYLLNYLVIFLNNASESSSYHIIYNPMLVIIFFVTFSSKVLGFTLGCIMYGWYGFDHYWIADGKGPDARFQLIEKRWVYLLGFGLPYGILVKNTTFFVGYGAYLTLFPLKIIMGSLLGDSLSNSSALKYSQSPLFRIFKLPQKLVNICLRHIDLQSKAKGRKKV